MEIFNNTGFRLSCGWMKTEMFEKDDDLISDLASNKDKKNTLAFLDLFYISSQFLFFR